jgi:NADH dehydrogenase
VALQGGMHAGRQIRRHVEGRPRDVEAFRYYDLGSAAYISRFHGVVNFHRIRLSGFLGWFVWGFIHLAFLHGSRHRSSTLTTWLYSIVRGRRTERAYPLGDMSDAEGGRNPLI